MNAVEPPQVFFRSMATRGRSEVARGARRCHRRVPGGRVRPRDRGDAGHRSGRRRDRRPLRCVALRDDAGVRRRQPAGEDRHARLRRRGGDQQVRAARRRGRPARRAATAGPQQGAVRRRSRVPAGVRHHRVAVQRRRRHRALPAPPRRARRAAASASTRAACRRWRGGRARRWRRSCRPSARRYLAEVAATVRAHHATTDEQVAAARLVEQLLAVRDVLRERGAATDDLDAALDDAEQRASSTRRAPCSMAGRRSATSSRRCRVASRSPATSSRGLRSPATRRPASCSGSSARRTCRGGSPSRPGCSRSSERARTRPACSPARATRSAPTGASTS